MDLWFFLMELAMLLGGAFLLGALAQRMRQSPIVGYLLTGTIIGPLVFNATAITPSHYHRAESICAGGSKNEESNK